MAINMIKLIAAIIVLSGLSLGQTKINPPKIDYSLYGSVAHKMRVYEYTQSRIDDLERERYRLFREEVRRQMPPQERVTIRIVRRTECRRSGGTRCRS